jgi:beta-glucanase (GH16 family)
MRVSPAHRLLGFLWLATVACSAALLGYPGVAAVARSGSDRPPIRHGTAVRPDLTRALLASAPWRLRFEDEFNGASLNLHKWQPNWLGADPGATTPPDNRRDLNCVAPGQVKQADGLLGLAATPRRCRIRRRVYRFTSGLINTSQTFHFTYGLLAARIFIPPTRNHTPANFPAFWALGSGPTKAAGELDVMEALRGCGPGLGWHFHGELGAPGACVALAHPSGWHVFAADWEPGQVTFYYDGQRVGQLTSGITHRPMYLVLNNSIDPTYGGSSRAPATMLVDWVRVWQRPQSRLATR